MLAVEGGGEPVGHGAADAVAGMATGDTVFEEDAVALESKSGRLPPIFLREPRTAPYCVFWGGRGGTFLFKGAESGSLLCFLGGRGGTILFLGAENGSLFVFGGGSRERLSP